MQLLIQQLPALLGVLVGAFATYLVTASTERVRWRRQQSVRWDERRLNAYTEYANALKKVVSVATRLAAQRGFYPGGESLAGEANLSDLAQAEEQRTIRWEAVLMLGSNEVVLAGRMWHQAVFRLERLACGETTDLNWAETIRRIGQARRRFYEVAKRDIGIPVGRASEAYEWQLSKWVDLQPDTTADAPDRTP